MTIPRLLTPLARSFPHLTTPIILAPMAGASGSSLSSSVSNAGGFGFIGAAFETAEGLGVKMMEAVGALKRELRGAESGGIGIGTGRAEIGVGLLGFRLTQMDGHDDGAAHNDERVNERSTKRTDAIKFIDTALELKPRAIWLSFGEIPELIKWSKVIRDREVAVNGGDGKEMKLFIQIGTEEGLKAVLDGCSADVIVVQGNESGGHGYINSPPLSAFIPLARSLIDRHRHHPRPHLLAAGGLSNGSSLASVLALGADGAVFGTRFLLTPEATYSDAQKSVLIHSAGADTKRTEAFDHVRGIPGWPAGVDGRGIYNETVREYEEAEGKEGEDGGEGEELGKKRYAQAAKEGDVKRIAIWAGTGVEIMDTILPAEQVVKEITQEAVQAIERLKQYVVVA